MKNFKYIYWNNKFVWAKLEKDGSISLGDSLLGFFSGWSYRKPFKFEQEAIKDVYFK